MSEENNYEIGFMPLESTQAQLLGDEEGRVVKLTNLASKIKEVLESSGLKKWEVSLEGYIEASSGFLPGGKASFKAILKLSNS